MKELSTKAFQKEKCDMFKIPPQTGGYKEKRHETDTFSIVGRKVTVIWSSNALCLTNDSAFEDKVI